MHKESYIHQIISTCTNPNGNFILDNNLKIDSRRWYKDMHLQKKKRPDYTETKLMNENILIKRPCHVQSIWFDPLRCLFWKIKVNWMIRPTHVAAYSSQIFLPWVNRKTNSFRTCQWRAMSSFKFAKRKQIQAERHLLAEHDDTKPLDFAKIEKQKQQILKTKYKDIDDQTTMCMPCAIVLGKSAFTFLWMKVWN